ncbi:MAG: hypothetical protein IPM42_08730 [Saprospiraceae bacterium]|nr:hypothetical protein [Saprospiraceae bacterium]
MSQLHWSYEDTDKLLHNIQLYHGAESGHLLIYVNDKIVLIDFHIQSDKTYGFYIESVFFELFISGNPGNYSYKMVKGNSILDYTDLEKKETYRDLMHKRITWIFVITIVILSILLTIAYYSFK